MSIEEEARRQLEAQRRAAQELERQRLARQQAIEDRNRGLDLAYERDRSEAISKFRGLNPEGFLEEVRRAWHAGRVVRFSDPLYIEIAATGAHHLDGVMLYQQGDVKHSSKSREGHYESERGYDDHIVRGSSHWVPGYTVDTNYSPVDVARIVLDSGNTGYEVVLEDRSGSYEFGYYLTNLSPSPKRFNVRTVRPEDIHAFFVQTTAARMAGEGSIRIR